MTRDATRGVFQPASNSAPQIITWTRKVILAPEEDRCAYYKVGVARSSESFVKSNSSDRRRPSALAEGCGRNAGENSPQYALKSLFEYQRTVSARPTSQDFSCRHPSAKSFEQSMKYLRSLKARSLTCSMVVSGSQSRSLQTSRATDKIVRSSREPML